MAFDLIFRNAQLVEPECVRLVAVAVEAGTVVAIEPEINGSAGEEIDAAGLMLFPGVIDPHVHFNEPGRTEWEGAATGSAAFAAGGGTLYGDMPLNSSPATIDGPAFDLKLAALKAHSLTDFAIWGGLGPHNHAHLPELAERGVFAFKAFMCNSGIEDFPAVSEDQLGRGMEIAAKLGLPVGVHAEDDELTSELTQESISSGRTSVRDYLASRPIRAEVDAIERAIKLAEQTGCKLHIVHVSSGEGVAAVAEGRSRGVDVTCETCPHYLFLTDEDVVRIGAAAKCSPPIRDAATQVRLRQELFAGRISFVASDHSPAPQSMKTDANFFRIWGGIAGVQTTLGLMGASGFSPPQIGRALAFAAAERFSFPRKGAVRVGADADFSLVDGAASWKLERSELLYRHPISPFLSRDMKGRVLRTFVRGRTVYPGGRVIGSGGGQFVRPGATR